MAQFETRGRRPEYNDKRFLRKRIDEYFDQCEKDGVFADYAGMRLFLRLKKKDIDDLCNPDIKGDEAEEYQDIFDYARDRRESILARKMVQDPKSATGCKAALAMPENGGYSERAVENQDRKINIRVSEENAELFK